MMNWRVTAGAAIFAAAISFLAGLIRGNPPGVIFVRLLLSSLFMGGLAMAAQTVLRRFLPELEGVRPAGRGPFGGEDGSAEDLDPAAGSRPIVDILLPAENPHNGGPGADEEFPGLDPATLFGAAAEPEELEAALEEEDPDSGLAGTGGALPEIDRLDGSFGAGDFEPKAGGSGPKAEGVDRKRLEHGLQGQDPMEMARAVRTFLNKDQEG